MALFSTVDALNSLCTSVPDWCTRLDDLNGQIALRQIELARLTDSEHPTPRSVKNKGSTESLRPREDVENHCTSNNEPVVEHQPGSPRDTQAALAPNGNRPNSPAAARAVAVVTPPPGKASSSPRPSPGALQRQSSQPTPPTTQPRKALRKRKTDSLASNESVAPKYRTRSMIIVYYDSAVQNAFEEMVKFVSGSRNAMRKGKMAAKMAEMQKAAELEVDNDEDADDGFHSLSTNGGHLLSAQKSVSVGKQGETLLTDNIGADDSDKEMKMPELKFVSTRNMGPRNSPRRLNTDNGMSTGLLRGYRRGAGGPAASDKPDIFDTLDKSLAWCQGQCEIAAHQFLRDGDCSTEIESIKRRLGEIKETAQTERDRIKKEEEESAPAIVAPRTPPQESKRRELKSPQMRRDLPSMKALEADNMEVDDESEDDLDAITKSFVFKRSKDIVY